MNMNVAIRSEKVISNKAKMMLSLFFLGLGIVLPMLTSQIKEIGDTLLPMHLVIMLCGMLCGCKYGLAVGFMLPFVRSAMFTMPPLFPNAVWMSFELATYGFVIGFLYDHFGKKSILNMYLTLIVTMLSGRIVWGIAKALLLAYIGKAFTVNAFLIGAFADALPGIAIQLIVIPVVAKTVMSKRDKEV